MGQAGTKPSTTSNERSIYKDHRPHAPLRPVAAVRLAMVPLSSPLSSDASVLEGERERDVDARARCRLASAPEPGLAAEPVADPGGEFDARLLGILAGGPADGETLDAAFRRKERELGALFATLDVATSRALHRRLSISADGDVVAARFGRLVSERRARLLAFLADARRREAIARARSFESTKG